MQSVPFLSYVDVGTGRLIRRINAPDVGSKLNSTIALADNGKDGTTENNISTSRVRLPDWSGAMSMSPTTGLIYMGHNSCSVMGSAYKKSVGSQSLVSLWSPSEEFNGPVMVIDLASAAIGTHMELDKETGTIKSMNLKTRHYHGMVSHIATHKDGHNFAVCLSSEYDEKESFAPYREGINPSTLFSPFNAFVDDGGIINALNRKYTSIVSRYVSRNVALSKSLSGVINVIMSNASISTKLIQPNQLREGESVRDRIKVKNNIMSRSSSSCCILFDLRMPGKPINRVPLWHEKISGKNTIKASPVVDMDISETGMLAIAYGNSGAVAKSALQSANGSHPGKFSSSITSCVEFWPGDIWTACEGGILNTDMDIYQKNSTNLKPVLCHRTPKSTSSITSFKFIPHNDNGVVCCTSCAQFIPVPGSGDPALPGIDNGIGTLSNPYASRKARADALVNSLIEKLPASTVTLHTEDIGKVRTTDSKRFVNEESKKTNKKKKDGDRGQEPSPAQDHQERRGR